MAIGDVLASGAAAPGVGARATVGEDAARDDETLLALGAQVGERAEQLFVDAVELGLDVRLASGSTDQRRVAAPAEQQADRVRQDGLPRSRLAGDRVQPGREDELRLADQDEVLDAEGAQHAPPS